MTQIKTVITLKDFI